MKDREIKKKFNDGHDAIVDIVGHMPPSLGFAVLMSITEKMLEALSEVKEDREHYQGQVRLFGNLMIATGQKFAPESTVKTKVQTPEDICRTAAKFMKCDTMEAAEFFGSEAGHFASLSEDKQIWFCPKFAFSLLMHILEVKE